MGRLAVAGSVRRSTLALLVASMAFGSALMPLGASAGAAPGSAELWVKRFNGPADAQDGAVAARVSPDGSKVYVAGHAHFNFADDYTTSAHEAATGAKIWANHYDGTAGNIDVPYAMALSPDGSRVFVTGASKGTPGEDSATVAYDALDGSQLWVARGPGQLTDYMDSIAVSPDGSKVFVTGNSGVSSFSNYVTVAYDASTGQLLWVMHYDGPGHGQDHATSVAATGSAVFVTGWSYGGGSTGYDYGTVAYDPSTGSELFIRRYDNAGGSDNAYAVAVSADGSKVAVTGTSFSDLGTYADYATVAYDAVTGSEVWAGRYSSVGSFLDTAYALAFAPDGTAVFVTGAADEIGPTGLDYATVAYATETGTQLWVRRYTGPGNQRDRALSIGVSPDGTSVFVTGESFVGGSSDYVTQAYRAADGIRRWSRRYDGPAQGLDVAASLAVSPDGTRVFVTGASERSTGNSDFATVAYAT